MIYETVYFKEICFPELRDERGFLSFIENGTHIPFDISRIFYIYGVGVNETRGNHAHKKCEQFIFPIVGSFKLSIYCDGFWQLFSLIDNENKGIYIAPFTWIKLEEFSRNAICMVLASEKYDKNDYINDFHEFERGKNES